MKVYRRRGNKLIRGELLDTIADKAMFGRDSSGPTPAKPIIVDADTLLQPTAELDAEYERQQEIRITALHNKYKS